MSNDHSHIDEALKNVSSNGHVNLQTWKPEDTDEDLDELGLPSYVIPYPQTERVTNNIEQQDAVEKAVRDLLVAFNANMDDPNYKSTPKRVAKAYMEYWVNGYTRTPEHEMRVFPNESNNDDMVIVKDIKFYSLCSHHLAPIEGFAAIAYIPDKHLLGLSKLGRILDIYARRFQLQERIGAQTADAIQRLLHPKGVMVVLYNVKHGCMSSRGIQLHQAVTTTSAVRGVFNESTVRAEVLSLLQLRTE